MTAEQAVDKTAATVLAVETFHCTAAASIAVGFELEPAVLLVQALASSASTVQTRLEDPHQPVAVAVVAAAVAEAAAVAPSALVAAAAAAS